MLRAGRVGLQDASGPAAAFTVDLLTLKEGEGAGELSLLANRPLWYSLVTTSDSVTVVSVDLQVGWWLWWLWRLLRSCHAIHMSACM